MEPSSGTEPGQETAFIHFSGVSVRLTGTGLRRVLHRISMHRCGSLHELWPGQTRPAKGEPLIERIDFIDWTKVISKERPN